MQWSEVIVTIDGEGKKRLPICFMNLGRWCGD